MAYRYHRRATYNNKVGHNLAFRSCTIKFQVHYLTSRPKQTQELLGIRLLSPSGFFSVSVELKVIFGGTLLARGVVGVHVGVVVREIQLLKCARLFTENILQHTHLLGLGLGQRPELPAEQSKGAGEESSCQRHRRLGHHFQWPEWSTLTLASPPNLPCTASGTGQIWRYLARSNEALRGTQDPVAYGQSSLDYPEASSLFSSDIKGSTEVVDTHLVLRQIIFNSGPLRLTCPLETVLSFSLAQAVVAIFDRVVVGEGHLSELLRHRLLQYHNFIFFHMRLNRRCRLFKAGDDWSSVRHLDLHLSCTGNLGGCTRLGHLHLGCTGHRRHLLSCTRHGHLLGCAGLGHGQLLLDRRLIGHLLACARLCCTRHGHLLHTGRRHLCFHSRHLRHLHHLRHIDSVQFRSVGHFLLRLSFALLRINPSLGGLLEGILYKLLGSILCRLWSNGDDWRVGDILPRCRIFLSNRESRSSDRILGCHDLL